jgi:magnesium-transporting ATPase (P-type)
MITIVLASCIQFSQDCVGTDAAIKLQAAILPTVSVRRFESADSHNDIMIDQRHLVPGDILYVDPGDTIPADCIVIEADDLLISQSK